MQDQTPIIQIKHMVCPRCITTVNKILEELKISFSKIELGIVHLVEPLSAPQLQSLKGALLKNGFEFLEDRESRMVNQVKSFIINMVHHSEFDTGKKLSVQLSELLSTDYATISRTFANVEGITIEKFMLNQKIEKVKELLSYEEMTITQIAFQLNYSSAAHLSSQFKKMTGIPPSTFQKLHKKPRKHISDI